MPLSACRHFPKLQDEKVVSAHVFLFLWVSEVYIFLSASTDFNATSVDPKFLSLLLLLQYLFSKTSSDWNFIAGPNRSHA